EIHVGKNLVLLEKEIGYDWNGAVFEVRFDEPSVALVEEIHLSAEGGARFLVVKLREERIVLAIENAASVHLLREDACECGFADANRPFDDDVARRLEPGAGHGARL